MAAATAFLGASDSVWVLLTSRILQGFSASIVWTVGLALTVDTVGKDQLAQWMGTALSSSSVGLVISPLLGGIVYAKGGLWGVLTMIISLIALNILLITLLIEKRTAKKYILIDTSAAHSEPQSAPAHRNSTYETFGPRDIHIHTAPSSDTTETQKPLLSASTLPAASSPTPTKANLPPLLILLRSPRILAGAYGIFTQFGLLASFDAFLPLFVQRRFGWGSLGAGLIFLAIAIPALTGPLAGKLADRFGNRRMAVLGAVLGAPPLVGLRWVGYKGGEGEWGQVVLLAGLLGLVGMFFAAVSSSLFLLLLLPLPLSSLLLHEAVRTVTLT